MYTEETFNLTTSLLSQNPEYYTIWNFRRIVLLSFVNQDPPTVDETSEIEYAQRQAAAEQAALTLQQYDILLLLKEDLQFLVPLLRQFPKCYWIWNHRIWLLGEATTRLPAKAAIELWQVELGLVTKMLSLDNRNFHGWDYRRKTVSELERLSGQSMVTSEFDYTTKMIKSNLSNFSSWHNRSQLIPRLLDERAATQDERRKFLEDELQQINTALYIDPYDQSLWFYHQYLMSTLDSGSPTNSIKYPRKTTILFPVDDADRLHYLKREIASIQDMLDGAEDCKYIYQALFEYSTRYRKLSSSNNDSDRADEHVWLQELKSLDALRRDRWQDLEQKMS